MKSFLKLLYIFFLITGFYSCSTSSSASDELKTSALDYDDLLSPQAVVYTSSISNLISTFPHFSNKAVNSEVDSLKLNLKDYLNGIKSFNAKKTVDAVSNFERSYKKIQKLRKSLNQDDDQLLNRYLVKIKTNVNLLESHQTKKEDSSIISSN